MKINAFAAPTPGATLVPYSYEPAPLGPQEVEIRITHCGICHSDLHLVDNDWAMTTYPTVPGHEIVGTVAEVGELVTALQPGQRVGVGWQAGACLSCEWCLSGQEQLCKQHQPTCVGRPGGFAESIRLDHRFVFDIPEALESENAAPLLCGGITVYSPLRLYGVKPEHKVGVIGIGGLGHLALQFANAYGCEVTAFSTSPDKEAEARSLGAHHFVVSKDAGQMKAARESLDFIISTVFAQLDWKEWLKVLRPNGKLCFVGAGGNLEIPAAFLLMQQKTVCGSSIGGRAEIRDMLNFAARHGIKAQTEVVPLDQVNAALDKLRKNEARYRMVLQMPG